MRSTNAPTYLEFFCGGGMARLGLGPGWRCLLANDICPKKMASYLANFPGAAGHAVLGDVWGIDASSIDGRPDLAWASFPCQDLSLAGGRRGLAGARSGAFWGFWRVVESLAAEGRAPRAIVLENVVGTITSNGGRDFEALVLTLAEAGYRVGPMVVDAAHFLPQSRPRLFVVAVDASIDAGAFRAPSPAMPWHPHSLARAFDHACPSVREAWRWWSLPAPERVPPRLEDLVEWDAEDLPWHPPEQTRRILGLMSPVNAAKVAEAKRPGRPVVGAVYRRTRPAPNGRQQRAEVRFDGLSGCLRTPAGGSSRQTLLFVEGRRVRTRLLSAREAARLMGIPDEYALPPRYNDAYHLAGDGVAVPAVRWIAAHLLEPMLAESAGVGTEQPRALGA